MSYTLQDSDGKQILLKNGSPVAVLDSDYPNDPIVLDNAFNPALKDDLVEWWAVHHNYESYLHATYLDAKAAHDQEEEFKDFETWKTENTADYTSKLSYVVEAQKQHLENVTKRYEKLYLEKQTEKLSSYRL